MYDLPNIQNIILSQGGCLWHSSGRFSKNIKPIIEINWSVYLGVKVSKIILFGPTEMKLRVIVVLK